MQDAVLGKVGAWCMSRMQIISFKYGKIGIRVSICRSTGSAISKTDINNLFLYLDNANL